MLPGLKVLIGADTSGLEKGIKDAERELGGLRGTTDRMGRGMQDFGDAARRVGTRMSIVSGVVAAVGGGMFALAKGTADAGNEIDKSARAAGLSTDAFQDMRFAIGQVTDLSDGEFSNAMMQMNRRIGQAADGNEGMIKSLQDLGFTQEEIANGVVGTEEAFMALSEALQGVDNDAEAARIAGELFGERMGGRLGPALREAGGDMDELRARAHELGIVLTEDTIKASADFTDKMSEVSQQMGAAKNAIGQALLPAALGMATAFQDKIIPAIVSVAEAVAGAIEWFGNLPGPVQEAAGLVAAALGVGGPIVLAVGVLSKVIGGLLIASGPIGLFIAAAGLLTAAWMKWGDDIVVVVGDAVDWIKTKFNELITWLSELPARMFEIGANIIHGLRDGIREAWEGARESISGAFSGVVDTARGIFRTQSPSLVFHEIGMNIGEGLRNGIQDSFGMVRSAVQGLGQQVTSGAFDMASGVVDAMGQMFQGSKPIAAAQALINTFQGITEALKLPFPASLAAAAKVAAQGFAAVKGIQSARPGSTGGAASSGGGGGGSQSQAAQVATQRLRFEIAGSGPEADAAFRTLQLVQQAIDNGGRLDGLIAERVAG